MQKIIFFLTVIFSALFVTSTAYATFEDGINTVEKKLFFSVAVKAGDVIEVDYYRASQWDTGVLSISKLNGELIYKNDWPGKKEKTTVKYTFEEDYNGFIVAMAGDQSIRNAIYEVRINSEMVFDGKNFVSNYIDVDPKFVTVMNIGINKVRLIFNGNLLPEGYEIKEMVLYQDENSLIKTESNSFHNFVGLVADTTYKYTLKISFKNGKSSKDIPVIFKTLDINLNGFANVKNITSNSADINFDYLKLGTVPQVVNLYDSAGDLVSKADQGTSKITLKNLKEETQYEYYVEVVFDEKNKSEKEKIIFTTISPDKEVTGLTATSTEKEVNLLWKMPVYKDLDVARIYRQKSDVGLFARILSVESTYEPLFETNGTTFKDLTVKSDTEYKYKVTTVDTADNETEGKVVTVKTKKLTVSGGGTELDTDGNYVITWTSPIAGKIKVLVGGIEYAIVPATDKKIIIPKDKMKFDLIGKPDVILIPIDEDGKEGTATKPGGGGSIGGIGEIVGGGAVADVLNPGNLLKAGVQLLVVIGGFVLLALAFRVVPKLVHMIRIALIGKSDVQVNKRRVQD